MSPILVLTIQYLLMNLFLKPMQAKSDADDANVFSKYILLLLETYFTNKNNLNKYK